MRRETWSARLEWLVAVLIVAATATWHLTEPVSGLEVINDSERDLLRAWRLVHHGEWPPQGPPLKAVPVHLGPAYYVIVGPLLAAFEDPLAVYGLMVLASAIGLLALFASLRAFAGGWAAAILLPAAGSSLWLHESMQRLPHSALLPGLALCWTALVFPAIEARTRRRREWALAGGWMLGALMLQVHMVAVLLAPVQVALQVHHYWREGLRLRRPLAWVPPVALGLVLAVFGSQVISADWSTGVSQTVQQQGGKLQWSAGMFIEAWAWYLGNATSTPPRDGIPIFILLAALVGLVTAARDGIVERRLGAPQWLAATLLVQVGLAAWLSSLSLYARYFSALMPFTYAVAMLGAGWILRRVPRGPLAGAAATAAMAFLVFQGTALTGAGGERPPREGPRLGLVEQEALVTVLDEQLGFCREALDERLHGPVFGFWSAVRLLAVVRGLPETCPDGPHVTVAPDGWPEPSGGVERVLHFAGSGRRVVLVVHRPRFAPEALQVSADGRRCEVALPVPAFPYLKMERPEITAHGFRTDEALRRCAGHGRALRIEVPPVSGDGPLTLVVDWFDPGRPGEVRSGPSGGPIEVRAALDQALTGTHTAYRIPVAAGAPLVLTLARPGEVQALDLY